MTNADPMPDYSMGWDEETVYLDSDKFTGAEALAAFRRISLEEFGMTEDDIDGIEPVAQTVPSHDADESTHVFDGVCPDCHPAEVWTFAP